VCLFDFRIAFAALPPVRFYHGGLLQTFAIDQRTDIACELQSDMAHVESSLKFPTKVWDFKAKNFSKKNNSLKIRSYFL
jgi:hypothetical protein